jgi:metal-dependent amidase/aminoacylase/carboxypeptidase family protein
LICVGGIAAGFGAVERLKADPQLSGQVVILGTPAEEGVGSDCTLLVQRTDSIYLGGGGKYFLLEGGAFKAATASLMLHPGDGNVAFFSSAAIATCNVTFRGKPAHAAASPWEGTNCMDALVLGHTAIGLLRQQLLPSDRIHGNIINGGQAVNIIPAFCTAMYAVRSPNALRVKDLMGKLENCFEGAALATGTTLEINWTRTLGVRDGNKIAGLDVHSNHHMAKRFQDYVSADGTTKFIADGGQLSTASTVRPLLMFENNNIRTLEG